MARNVGVWKKYGVWQSDEKTMMIYHDLPWLTYILKIFKGDVR
jgi:hypothetical protein